MVSSFSSENIATSILAVAFAALMVVGVPTLFFSTTGVWIVALLLICLLIFTKRSVFWSFIFGVLFAVVVAATMTKLVHGMYELETGWQYELVQQQATRLSSLLLPPTLGLAFVLGCILALSVRELFAQRALLRRARRPWETKANSAWPALCTLAITSVVIAVIYAESIVIAHHAIRFQQKKPDIYEIRQSMILMQPTEDNGYRHHRDRLTDLGYMERVEGVTLLIHSEQGASELFLKTFFGSQDVPEFVDVQIAPWIDGSGTNVFIWTLPGIGYKWQERIDQLNNLSMRRRSVQSK